MRRRRLTATGWLLRLVLVLIATPLLLVALLGVMPPPTSAFMLQSPTRPVAYEWAPRERIAEHARRAVVAAEDQKFWDHQGFDLTALRQAWEHNQSGQRVRGGSTISQQTAKNLFLWSGGGYLRKGIEAAFATLIELLWSKQRILEVYLNIAEFGPGVYGVEAAAQRYFGKPAARLSAYEAARLAAVLPSPRRWQVLSPGPYVQRRTDWILRQMGRGSATPAPAAAPTPMPASSEVLGEPDPLPPADEPTPSPPTQDPEPLPSADDPESLPLLPDDEPFALPPDLPPPGS